MVYNNTVQFGLSVMHFPNDINPFSKLHRFLGSALSNLILIN